MKCVFAFLIVASSLAAIADPIHAQTRVVDRAADDAGRASFKKLEGVWVVTKIISAGEPIPEEGFLHEFHFEQPNRLLRKGITVGKVTGRDREDEIVLDDSKEPAHMNLTRTVRGKKQTVFAIYKLEDDLLTICFLRGPNGRPLSERPNDFKSDEETKSDLLVLKRKPKSDD